MNDQERDSLQRDLTDALAALQQNKLVPSLDGLADHLLKLGGPFRFHAALIRGGMARNDHGALMGQLIQVLDKLERGVS
jgi:hypothetical protein